MKYSPPERPLQPDEPARDFERDEDARDEQAERDGERFRNDQARVNDTDPETEALFERAWEEVNHVA